MIISFALENYKSFGSKQTLSLEATASKYLYHNIITTSLRGIYLLKSVVLYGPNASGKSNLIKALNLFKMLIMDSGNFSPDIELPYYPFKLSKNYVENPTTFELTFILDGKKFLYTFSYNKSGFQKEELYFWQKSKRKYVFLRNKKNIKYNREFRNLSKVEQFLHPKTLFLSKAVQNNVPFLEKIYQYISKNIIVLGGPPSIALSDSMTVRKILENDDFKSFVINFLRSGDFGNISDLKILKTKAIKSIINSDGEIKKQETIQNNLFFIHENNLGEEVFFDENEESLGTKKVIFLLWPIYFVLKNKGTLFIDELDSSIHPNILKLIIQLFYGNLNNPSQLIFTTHLVSLLDNFLFRPDQIYFTNKLTNQETELYSLADFRIRSDANYFKKYISGRFGAIPIIDYRFIDDIYEKNKTKV